MSLGWSAVRCGLANTAPLSTLGVLVIMMLAWLLSVLLVGAEALPGGGLFTLLAVLAVGQMVGEATQVVGLPPLIGMLVTGVVARSMDLYLVSGVYVQVVTVLRYSSA